MKITKVIATPINVPMEAPYIWSVGMLTGMPKTVVQVFTDEGLIGIGEGPSDAQACIINDVIGPYLIGKDPLQLTDLEAGIIPEWRSAMNICDPNMARAWGAIDIALWDLRGKFWEQPLYQLLGGAYRKDIKFTEYFTYRLGKEQSVEDVVDYCVRMKEEHGSLWFEGKAGFSDAQNELKLYRRLREELGEEAQIRIDANYGWSLPTARMMVRELESLNIRNIEDPVIGIQNMARLRQHTSIPFSTHEMDLPQAVACGAPDAFVGNIATLGGVAATVRFAAACEAMGRNFWFYSGDGGIMTAAYMHITAAMPGMTEPHQLLSRWQTIDVIEEGVFKAKNNIIRVPEGHGLGVTLNEELLKAAHQHYLDNGPCDEFKRVEESHPYNRCPRF